MPSPHLLTLAEVHRLVSSWPVDPWVEGSPRYADAKSAVWRWRRAKLLAPAATDAGSPLFRHDDVVAAEVAARRARPGQQRRDAARARAVALFEALVPAQRHADPPAQTSPGAEDRGGRATI